MSMSDLPITPEERFASVVEALAIEPGVTPPSDDTGSRKRFGASALKVHDKIFAMLAGGEFVLKLPRQRVDVLIASGEGKRFDPGHGRLMKEWVAVRPTDEADWLSLAREAMAFVDSMR